MLEFSHLLVSPPHIEQSPFGLNPPHDPESGFLLKITRIWREMLHFFALENDLSPRQIHLFW